MPRSTRRKFRPRAESPVEALSSLGATSAAWLNEVGIQTYADLKRVGSVAAYRLVKQRRPRVSRNLLYALEAALRNQAWHEFLTPQLRAQLTRRAEEQDLP